MSWLGLLIWPGLADLGKLLYMWWAGRLVVTDWSKWLYSYIWLAVNWSNGVTGTSLLSSRRLFWACPHQGSWFPEGEQKCAQLLKAEASKCLIFISAFSWSKQVTGPVLTLRSTKIDSISWWEKLRSFIAKGHMYWGRNNCSHFCNQSTMACSLVIITHIHPTLKIPTLLPRTPSKSHFIMNESYHSFIHALVISVRFTGSSYSVTCIVLQTYEQKKKKTNVLSLPHPPHPTYNCWEQENKIDILISKRKTATSAEHF